MARLIDLLVRFRRDEGGAFAVIFGAIAIVLVALSGAVVDYVGIEQARSRGQIALDAAALALQPKIFNSTVTKADLKAQAQALLVDRLGASSGVTGSILDVQTDTEAGALYLLATMSMPTSFVRLVGVPTLSAQIESEATRKKLELEIAFVLDNSGSMALAGAGTNGTRQRMQFLKDAANCAVNIMFYKDVVDSTSNPDTCVPATGATKLDDVKIGLVPFTMFVNVGSGNRSATWLDQNNASVAADDNFDNDDNEDTSPATSLPTRFSLFNGTGEAWRGCVEARPHLKSGTLATEYLDTDDTTPAAGNTLFVPLLSPDAADSVGGNNYLADEPAICDRPNNSNTTTTCSQTQLRTSCNSSMSNTSCTTQNAGTPAPVGDTNFFSNTQYAGGYYGAHAPNCECRTWGSYSAWSYLSGTGNGQTWQRTRTCSTAGYIPRGLSARESFERVCKYRQTPTTTSFSSGPNADCTRTAILPLTTTPATVTSTITSMVAEGGTNIHEGAAWGARVLSPTAPFTEGGPFTQATSKVMILMTDGENTAYNLSNYCNSSIRTLLGNCYNSAYGFPFNSKNTSATSTSGGNVERMGTLGTANTGLVSAMNERLRQTCENAKAKGITVYVIGLATSQAVQSTQAEVEDMLADCASTRDKAYFPQEPAKLKSVFQEIANDLTALRLAK